MKIGYKVLISTVSKGGLFVNNAYRSCVVPYESGGSRRYGNFWTTPAKDWGPLAVFTNYDDAAIFAHQVYSEIIIKCVYIEETREKCLKRVEEGVVFFFPEAKKLSIYREDKLPPGTALARAVHLLPEGEKC